MAFEEYKGDGWFRPISRAVAVSESPNEFTGGMGRALYLGTSGNVEVRLYGSENNIILNNLAAGVWHPMAVTHLIALGGGSDAVVGY